MPDKTTRYVTHLPVENIDRHLSKLGKVDLQIIAFCMIQSQSVADIASYLHTAHIQSLCKRIANLANMGYLANVYYHVNGDTFTTLNHDATMFHTYPAIRSERIAYKTTRLRSHGGYN